MSLTNSEKPLIEEPARPTRTRRPPSRTSLQHDDLRENFKSFSDYLKGVCPEGRYLSLALTELEACSMWAHKALSKTAPFESTR